MLHHGVTRDVIRQCPEGVEVIEGDGQDNTKAIVAAAKTGKRARELIPSLLALIRRHFRHSVVAKAKLWLLRDHGT